MGENKFNTTVVTTRLPKFVPYCKNYERKAISIFKQMEQGPTMVMYNSTKKVVYGEAFIVVTKCKWQIWGGVELRQLSSTSDLSTTVILTRT